MWRLAWHRTLTPLTHLVVFFSAQGFFQHFFFVISSVHGHSEVMHGGLSKGPRQSESKRRDLSIISCRAIGHMLISKVHLINA